MRIRDTWVASGREQTQADTCQQLPVLERVGGHLIGVKEEGARDDEADPE